MPDHSHSPRAPFTDRHPYTVKVAHTSPPYSAYFSNLPLACETALARDGAVITPSGSVLGPVDCRVELANHKPTVRATESVAWTLANGGSPRAT